ncbi:MAG: hypothetical protein VB111_11725 [Clostridiaceae bacterium]|nr:hypothetical protein [Clostridiaceae bacterium]
MKQVNPDTGVVTTVYLANGLPENVTDARGNTTSFVYDGRGLLARKYAPTGSNLYARTDYTYDKSGRLTREESNTAPVALGGALSNTAWTEFTYNLNGTLSGKTTSAGREEVYTYNADRFLTQTATKIDASRSRITMAVYDFRGNVTESATYEELCDLDWNSNSTSLVAQTTTYTYDLNGSFLSVTYPNTETVTYAYDLLGRETLKTYYALNAFGVRT